MPKKVDKPDQNKKEEISDKEDSRLGGGYFNLIHLKREKLEALSELKEEEKHIKQALKDIAEQMDSQEFQLEARLKEKRRLNLTITLEDYQNEPVKEDAEEEKDREKANAEA